MRITLLLLGSLFVSLRCSGAGAMTDDFIRYEGTYKPEPTASFGIAAGASGLLLCTVEFTHQEVGESSKLTDKLSLDIPRGGKFLGYWDRPRQTLWIATEKKLISASRMGTTNYATAHYVNTPENLALTPVVFRREVERLLKAP